MLSIFLSIVIAVLPTSVTGQNVLVQELDVPTFDQQVYLTKLANCESGGRPEIKILDSNNKYSYGFFQFQEETFLGQSKKYGFNFELKDIYGIGNQVILTHKILSQGGEYHWKNCTSKLGKYPVK